MAASRLIDYLNASPSPYHAVENARNALQRSDFVELKEKEQWKIVPGGKYYFTRNQSTIVAFAVGGAFKPGQGFAVVGAHTDSPCLRVKPKSKISKSGYSCVGVECYGGGLWHTWFDRDLGLAGRVMVRKDTKLSYRLVAVPKPILRIPTLAIHLDRGVNQDGFKFNMETQLIPVLTVAAEQALNKDKPTPDGVHPPMLLQLLAEELGCQVEDIADFDLCLFDTQSAVVGGASDDFIFSARLDNLQSSFSALQGLLGSLEDEEKFKAEPTCRVVALFDHEEIGSNSAQGADSSLFGYVLQRLSTGGEADAFIRAVPKSFIVSSDMGHAVHPNYSEKHEANHQPAINKGPVIKYNANQRYATNPVSATILREIARKVEVPVQSMVVRNDSTCGSTIGPILAAGLGIRTLDVGCPQLSMHSIREMSGTKDVDYYVTLLQGFFTYYTEVDASVECD